MSTGFTSSLLGEDFAVSNPREHHGLPPWAHCNFERVLVNAVRAWYHMAPVQPALSHDVVR
eukprot:296948-Rhodomonas_salina.4